MVALLGVRRWFLGRKGWERSVCSDLDALSNAINQLAHLATDKP